MTILFVRGICCGCGIDTSFPEDALAQMPVVKRRAALRVGTMTVTEERVIVCESCERSIREQQGADASWAASAEEAARAGASVLKGEPGTPSGGPASSDEDEPT